MSSSIVSPRLAIVGLLALSMVASGCKDSTAPDDEPDVDRIRLVVGSQTITVNSAGVVTGGPITVAAGSTTPVTATFLKADGTVESKVTAAEFELRATSDNAAIATFTRTGAFAGNVVAGATAGSTLLRFFLFHLEEQHEDFGPHPVPITVQ